MRPFYVCFVRSGVTGVTWEDDLWLIDNTMGWLGHTANFWAGTSLSTDGAGRIVFDESIIFPSGNAGRNVGFPLRCLYAS